MAEAVREGGVTAIEVTPATPGALQVLAPARVKLGRGILLGLGSILTPEAAREAIRAGAAFVAAPNLNPDVLQACGAAGVPAIPGAFTPTEILQAWKFGASLVKVFPAGPVGAGYIREILVSQPDVRLVPTGGISLQNVGEFIRAGAAAVGVDDEIVSKDLLAQREFSEISRRARAFVEAVQRARGQVGRPGQPVRPVEGPDIR
jgi:2-dehydro-3-deoxyphosphogluconate aldolase/(4S)-4-hydroxy-2-oxoglutarate aldolase